MNLALDPQLRTGPGRLRVGLVNNMPFAAVPAAEQQFRAAFEAYGPCDLISFHWREIVRTEVERARLDRQCLPGEMISHADLDALIVTGAEPTTARLEDEPFYPRLQDLLAYAERTGLPVLFSCLAAHAAALSLAGVARRALPQKLSGVFSVEGRASDPGGRYLSPHSRWNDLWEDDLVRGGFEILASGPACGVDAFRTPGSDQFFFLQGHPEYASETLLLEYRRDLLRALQRPGAPLPPPPANYLPDDAAAAFCALAAAPRSRVADDEARQRLSALAAHRPPRAWAGWSRHVFGRWIGYVLARRRAALSL